MEASSQPSTNHAPTRSANPPAAVWRVGLLGGLRLSDGAQHLVRLPSRAITALLARLALAPQRAHGREELIELLWPGVAIAVGRNRLRQALSSLKTILEPASRTPAQPVLLADRTHIRVVDGALSCDALLFEQHARTGHVAQALALYGGELLPGFYDEWIDDERVRLAAVFDHLPRATVPPREASDGPARDSAEPRAVAPPGVPQAGMPAARVTLPHYLTRMFGADEQGARLRTLVLGQRLVTVVGPGGAGKTRLAVEVAHSLRAPTVWPLPAHDPFEAFDLLAFVPLAPCTTKVQALDAVLSALQIAPGAATPLAALSTALSSRRALLVLDNFEQLVGQAEDLVAQLLAELPRLHLLVTSRHALGLVGEQEFALDTLALPALDAPLAVAAANPAVALFVAGAAAVRADFHLGARNLAAVVELVRALEGMPLAIELAACRVRSITPADMLARLRGPGTPHLDLLQRSGARHAADLHHASMQRTIAWSVAQLDPAQAALLAALTVFAGGFTAAAAAALTQAEPFDTPLLLDDLVAHSLVHRLAGADERPKAGWGRPPFGLQAEWPSPATHERAGARSVRAQPPAGIEESGEATFPQDLRFALYQPIREFAAARLSADQGRHWRAQLRAWARQWALALALPATPPLPHLQAEMPNLLAALDSAVADEMPGDAIELLHALGRCLEDTELPAQGLALAQAAVLNCADAALQARGHSLLGPMLFSAGQGAAALHHAELGVQGQAEPTLQRARALHALARVRWRSHRRAEEVEPLLAEADELARSHGDTGLIAPQGRPGPAANGQRRLAFGPSKSAQADLEPRPSAPQGDQEKWQSHISLRASLLALRAFITNVQYRDYPRAEHLHAQALALWQLTGNEHAINSGRYNLAVCAQNAGRHEECLQRLAPVVASAHVQQDWRRLSQAFNVSGNARSGLRDWPGAVADYQACIRAAWGSMGSYDLAYGLWNLPRALAHLRAPELAARLMAFAAAFWQQGFGEISAKDQRDVLRLRRLVLCQLPAARLATLWREGEALSLHDAVALALAATPGG